MSQLWALALVLTVGIGFIVTTFLSGLAGGVGHVINGDGRAHRHGAGLPGPERRRVLARLPDRDRVRRCRWRDLRTGAAIAAVCWQVLQLAGGYVVSHQLHRASELYGTFGIVLGLLAWLFLQAEVTLYAAEVDVVLARRLWPRSIMPAGACPGAGRRPAEPAQAGCSPPRPAAARRRPSRARPGTVGPRPFQCPPPGQPPNATGMMRQDGPLDFPGTAGRRQALGSGEGRRDD